MNKDRWLDEFSSKLREMIEDEGITQKQLAEESRLDRADISRYCNGQQAPSAKAIVNLAHALNCSTDELVDFDEMID